MSRLRIEELTMEYFVSLAGNDSNPGTLERPFATIAKGDRRAGTR